MLSAINDTLPSHSSGGQVVAPKTKTEEFDLIMAVMQLLLMPGPSVRLQTQDESGSVKASSTGTDSLELLAALLPRGEKEDEAVGLQGLNPPVCATVNDSGKGAEQVQGWAELSPDIKTAKVVMAAQNPEKTLNMAAAITENSVPQLPMTAPNNGQMAQEKAGLNQDVENGVKEGSAPAFEQKNMAVSLAGVEIKNVVSDQQAVTEAMAGDVSKTRVKKAFDADEMVRLAGRESGVNIKNEKSLKTYSPDKIEPLKSGWGRGFSCANDNPPQPDAVPAGTVLSTASLAESPKGVALPDLKERLAQEIKNVLANGKGEQQRQIQLKLEPEHLGNLTIKLFFNRDELTAHFYTGNNHVKEILEGSLQQLRDSLSQQDLRLNEALVFAGDDGGGGGKGRFSEERNGQAWLPHTRYYNHTYKAAQVDPVNLLAVTTDPSRVNYLI